VVVAAAPVVVATVVAVVVTVVVAAVVAAVIGVAAVLSRVLPPGQTNDSRRYFSLRTSGSIG
jgi:hypothetical protein